MLHLFDELPDDFLNEYQFLLDDEVLALPAYYTLLSDIEIGYSFTLVKAKWLHPSQYTLKLPGTLYDYIPDQRPLTIQMIGKPSSGPSPPFRKKISGNELSRIRLV